MKSNASHIIKPDPMQILRDMKLIRQLPNSSDTRLALETRRVLCRSGDAIAGFYWVVQRNDSVSLLREEARQASEGFLLLFIQDSCEATQDGAVPNVLDAFIVRGEAKTAELLNGCGALGCFFKQRNPGACSRMRGCCRCWWHCRKRNGCSCCCRCKKWKE